MLKKLFLILLFGSIAFSQSNYYQYQSFKMNFELQETSETARVNPFTDYRLNVIFSHQEKEYVVPGFYAADGNAANTNAEKGGIWRVIFTPPFTGDWSYKVCFKKGKNIAINEDTYAGTPVAKHHGKSGNFTVKRAPKKAKYFEQSGAVVYNNSRYLYTQNGEPLLIFGSNSPENFLAYEDIDSTYAIDPDKNYIKSYDAHVQDWNIGDPTWQDGKGKGIIGALNYLASKNMNAIYLLTLNIDGDSKDVWPFISHHRKDFKRYDVSKLAQWDIIFSHAEKLGIVIEVITQEQENQLLLDDGYLLTERKLYYRELIARFSHHKNIIWNIGEENGFTEGWPHGQNDQQRFAMIRYIKENDPYNHPVLMHTYPVEHDREKIVQSLLKYKKFDGLSMQVYDINNVYTSIDKWVKKSNKHHPWVLLMDEIGPYHTGTKPDREDPYHYRERTTVLWPSLMAGASGVQWYFGWFTSPNDLDAEDLRSRNNMWEQTAYARSFFERVDFAKMENTNHLISKGYNYCLGKPGETYILYLKYGGSTSLDLSAARGEFSIQWFNPREGGDFMNGSKTTVKGGDWVNIGNAPKDQYKDWVVLIKRK